MTSTPSEFDSLDFITANNDAEAFVILQESVYDITGMDIYAYSHEFTTREIMAIVDHSLEPLNCKEAWSAHFYLKPI